MVTLQQMLTFAWQCQETGDLVQAEYFCRQILQIDPTFADAHHLLGLQAHQMGRHAQAVTAYQQAIHLNPTAAAYHVNLGMAYKAQGQLDAAMASYRHALRLKPDSPKAHNNLANALQSQGNLADAIDHYRAALQLNPASAEVHNNLAVALTEQGQLEDAVKHCQQALRFSPSYAEAHNNLGNVLQKLGNLEDAVAQWQETLRLSPQCPEAHSNVALAMQGLGKLDEAACHYERALSLQPEFNKARWNRSLLLLLRGDFERGWADYDCRLAQPDSVRPSFTQPAWDGSDLAGRSILLYGEQGFGDVLQFIRYASLIRQRGGHVIVACHAPLLPLLANVPGIDQLVPLGSPLPPFDIQAALLSLPRILQTSLATIPSSVPYLRADADLVGHWRAQRATLRGFKVGIAWQGRPTYGADRHRSIPVSLFTRLAKVEGVKLISLQRGAGSQQLANVPALSAVTYQPSGLDETAGAFMDTAAIMKIVDLVISSDTAVPHLAGALSVPVWVALPFVPDWRWLLQREDCPWYPTMRLFRQSQFGCWDDVFARMARELQTLVAPAPRNSGQMQPQG